MCEAVTLIKLGHTHNHVQYCFSLAPFLLHPESALLFPFQFFMVPPQGRRLWSEGDLPSQCLSVGGTLSKLSPWFFSGKLNKLFSWRWERVCGFLNCSVSPLLARVHGLQLASLQEVRERLVWAALCAALQIHSPSPSCACR